MKDLRVYYKTDKAADSIDAAMDKEIEKVAKKFGLCFQGSGVEIGTGIRDIHYAESK